MEVVAFEVSLERFTAAHVGHSYRAHVICASSNRGMASGGDHAMGMEAHSVIGGTKARTFSGRPSTTGAFDAIA